MTNTTGWDNGLCQDYSKDLARWFSSRLDAREVIRRFHGDQTARGQQMTNMSDKQLRELAQEQIDKWKALIFGPTEALRATLAAQPARTDNAACDRERARFEAFISTRKLVMNHGAKLTRGRDDKQYKDVRVQGHWTTWLHAIASTPAGAKVACWRALDGHGLPQTDWIDGDPGVSPCAFIGGRIEKAYAHPPSAERGVDAEVLTDDQIEAIRKETGHWQMVSTLPFARAIIRAALAAQPAAQQVDDK